MEPAFNCQDLRDFLANLIHNCLNRRLSGCDGLLAPAARDGCPTPVLSLVQVNYGVSVVLHLFDRGSTSTKDAGDRTCRNAELDNVVGLLVKFGCIKQLGLRASDTLFPTFNKHLVWFEMLARPALRVLTQPARERDLDVVFLLKADNILSALTNQPRVVLSRYAQDFRGFIGLHGQIINGNPE